MIVDPSVTVSSVFFPGSHNLTSDRTIVSSDSVLFYVNSQAILKTTPEAFKGFLGSPLNDEQFEGKIVNIQETSSVLNIILHEMYGISCAKCSPTLDNLAAAVRQMTLCGMNPKDHIYNSESSTSPLFDMLLSQAPLQPIEVYTLAAQFDIHELAVKCSSHLLSYRLSELSDGLVTTMRGLLTR